MRAKIFSKAQQQKQKKNLKKKHQQIYVVSCVYICAMRLFRPRIYVHGQNVRFQFHSDGL